MKNTFEASKTTGRSNNRTSGGLACVLVASLAGTALAQPLSSLYSSGLLHEATGGSSLQEGAERRVRVMNIGSSGQDGVNVRMNSRFGGGVGYDIAQILGTDGASLSFELLATDGSVHGEMTMISHGDGTWLEIYDFSAVGATEITIENFDANGTPISVDVLPGPIVAKEVVPDWFCKDGSTPIPYGKWVVLCNSCSPVWVLGWVCSGTNDEFSFNGYNRVVSPQLPIGSIPPDGIGQVAMRSSGGGEFEAVASTLGTFGTEVHGFGGAHLTEECTPGLPCDQDHTVLVVSNLGASALEASGVSIDIGAGAQSGTFSAGLRCKSCWDLKSGTKAYDDSGNEMMRSWHAIDPGTGLPEIGVDFSGMGATEYTAEYFDPNGNSLGTFLITGGNNPWKPAEPAGSLCGTMFTEIWEWDSINHVWVFKGCNIGQMLRSPGGGGGLIGPVASMTLTPIGGDFGDVSKIVIEGGAINGDSGDDVLIGDWSVTNYCPSDFDRSGFVDGDDFDAFVSAFENGTDDADFDGSGFVDGDDYDAFVQAFESGC